MAAPDPSTNPDPLKAAFAAFYEEWLSGNRTDPDAFCERHPECGPELREMIDNFIFVDQGISEAGADDADDTIARPAPAEVPEGLVLGDFKVLGKIGSGGMGVVYEAEQLSLHRIVALKVLSSHLSFSPDAVKKFQREAEAGGRQNHPGIVSVFAVGEHEGIHYIAQELVPGGTTLLDLLKAHSDGTRLPVGYFRRYARLIAQAADALQHAHDAGVIHRDIKPSNILLAGEEETPKVTDFGLARVEDAMTLSRTGDLMGTPFYMSPEQVTGKTKGVDHRTDIYSLGVTLYEVLTLKKPFEGKSSYEVLKKIPAVDPPDPWRVNPRVPRDLSTICLKAMEKSPERRYQTMKEYAEDLSRYLSGEVVLAKPAGITTKILKRIKRNSLLSGAVGVAALAVLALMVWSVVYFIQMKSRYEEIQRQSDLNLVYRLKVEAEELWPAYPRKVKDLKRWLEVARGLLTRHEQYRQTFDRLQSTSQINAEEAELKDLLEKLNREINSIGNEESGLIMDVAKRLHFAENIREESIDKHKDEWDGAIASIADEQECPQYKGLVIEPILCLVPIGRDPDSGLWEFAHLQTGEKPKRDDDGRIILIEEMGLVFVLIPGGTFNMGAVQPSAENPEGSPNVDPQAQSDEGPVHEVQLKPFFLSKFEMTQAQWLRFTENNPSYYKPGDIFGGKEISLLHPVETVSWEECKKVLFQLNLRLPSESEWEFACRAGRGTVWWTGNEKESLKGATNLCDLFYHEHGRDPKCPYEKWLDDGYVRHSPVGSYYPNSFGLHDVCGNVWEWCQDSYVNSYVSTPTDGSAHESTGTTRRVRRSGGWNYLAFDGRSAYRYNNDPDNRNNHLGLRPACSLPE